MLEFDPNHRGILDDGTEFIEKWPYVDSAFINRKIS